MVEVSWYRYVVREIDELGVLNRQNVLTILKTIPPTEHVFGISDKWYYQEYPISGGSIWYTLYSKCRA